MMNTLELMEQDERATDNVAENENANEIIHLPFGLLGFERVKNYSLLTKRDEEPFMWLQMEDDAHQAFLVVAPFLVLSDYQPDISTDDVEFLGLQSADDALLLNVVTLRPNGQATINLKGPIVINRTTLNGKQVIPNNAAEYPLNHPLPVS